MRVLLVHNYYGSTAPSGENVAFEADRDLLVARGHEVATFCENSDSIRGRKLLGPIIGAASTVWNPFAKAAIKHKIAEFHPDIVHVHNFFPLISAAIFRSIPFPVGRVFTLHNYRILCANGIPTRDGRTCLECIEQRSAKPALRHGCYRDSFAATLPMTAMIALNRALGTWRRDVDALVALSDFQKDLLRVGGLPGARIFVKPNFCLSTVPVIPWDDRRNQVIFVGRVSEEKGVRLLIQAWRGWGAAAPDLVIVGDGPIRGELETEVRRDGGGRIRFLGILGKPDTRAEIARSRLLVLPSTSIETFGLVLLEAFAAGTPVAASNLGPFPSIVGLAGILFAPGSAPDILARLRALWDHPEQMRQMAGQALRVAHETYSEQASYDALMTIYRAAIRNRSGQDREGGIR